MRLIKPSFEIWEQEPGLEGVYKQIERAGRVCYKSEDKIAEGTAGAFVDRMIRSGHGAMLEHGTVYMRFDTDIPKSTKDYAWKVDWIDKLIMSPYSTNRVDNVGYCNLTTNLRVLTEISNGIALPYFLELMCEPTEYHAKRITVKFICDRGVSHEFVRHRVFSFAQESTRYCNYSKDKFGKECTFIIPSWLDIPEGEAYFHDGINFRVGANEENIFGESVNSRAWTRSNDWKEVDSFLRALEIAENQYFDLLNLGWIAQQARAVLPNSLKTELVMTGTIEQWEGFFELRDAGSAHPQAYELAHPLHEEFIKREYVDV